jgi:hypothetical protein
LAKNLFSSKNTITVAALGDVSFLPSFAQMQKLLTVE